MDKEDGSELEEEDHHLFGDHGLHTVDFPAVKFPTMGETGRPAGGSNPSNSGDALSTPQNDQQGQQAVHSNPVFSRWTTLPPLNRLPLEQWPLEMASKSTK
uniref:Uncharacterized protein n=1 Tax=Ditylenchus dipsaci TaxID=166011 RepID=A0A915DGG0_9BILA